MIMEAYSVDEQTDNLRNERIENLRNMSGQQLDLFIIGGGITGAGIAWDASVRRMKVGLVEVNDFAADTDSRPTKLMHGCLSYVKQGKLRLAKKVSLEHALLRRSTPYLVDSVPILLPIYKKGKYRYLPSKIRLSIHDWLADVQRDERRKMFNREETLKREPLINKIGLKGSGYYFEYRVDVARLTMEIVKSAKLRGAAIANYIKVTSFIYRNNRVIGVKVKDLMNGESFDIFAKKIVNIVSPSVNGGVHLVVDAKRLPIKQASHFDAPDGGMISVIPYSKKVYIWSPNTMVTAEPTDNRNRIEALDYLLRAINFKFPTVRLQHSDIESGWLGEFENNTNHMPCAVLKKDEIMVAKDGVITITSGRLSEFRKTAEKVVNLVSRQLLNEGGRVFPPCTTNDELISGGISLEGGTFERNRKKLIEDGQSLGLTVEQVLELLSRYGTNTAIIYSYLISEQDEESSLQDQLVRAEVNYCVTNEMAVTACDFFQRRTGWLYFDRRKTEAVLESVLLEMSELLQWDTDEIERQRIRVQEKLNLQQKSVGIK